MEQCWPEVRQIALPTVTIQNENAISTQHAMTIPHVNPLSEQPGHSRTVTIERSRSPSRSSSSQKGGKPPCLQKKMIARRQEQAQARCSHWQLVTARQASHHQIKEFLMKKPH